MKAIFIFLCSSIVSIGVPFDSPITEETKIEQDQVSLWTANLSLAKEKPVLVRIGTLALGLRNMGYRKSFEGHSPSVDVIYSDIQAEMLAISGHAKYFSNEIEKERVVLKSGGYPLDYDRNRQKYFEVLSHLPSPETVKVLGDFLQDERDFELAVWKDYGGEVHSSGGRSPNCNHASEALGALGLRNPPYAKGEFMDDIGKWRLWWEDIKTGKRAFSFTGQSVEYRFNPDGTWETKAMENPPDDSPRTITPGTSRENWIQSKPQIPTERVKHHSDPRHPWLGWIAGILILVLCGGWFWLRKTRS